MTPEQQRHFQLIQYLNSQQQQPTYEQFLAERGAGNPYAPAPQQQPDYGNMMSKMAQRKGDDYLQEALFSSGSSGAGAGQAVGTAANGGTMMSTGVIVPASQGAPMASSALGASTGGTGIMANAGAMGAGPLAGIAAATILGGRSALKMAQGKQKNWKNASLADNAGRVALAGATGGLSEVARYGLKKFGPVSTRKHQLNRWHKMAESEDPATAEYAKQYLEVIKAGDGSGKTFEDITGQEGGGSGRDVWGASAFFDAFKDKGGWLNSTEEQRELIAKKALDEGLLKGNKGDIVTTSDDALSRIGLIGDEIMKRQPTTQSPREQAIMRSGVAGNLAGLTGAQKFNPLVGQQPNPAGNISNAADLLPNLTKGPASLQGLQGIHRYTPNAPLMIPRTKTLSPGIGLDGKPISYGRR